MRKRHKASQAARNPGMQNSKTGGSKHLDTVSREALASSKVRAEELRRRMAGRATEQLEPCTRDSRVTGMCRGLSDGTPRTASGPAMDQGLWAWPWRQGWQVSHQVLVFRTAP